MGARMDVRPNAGRNPRLMGGAFLLCCAALLFGGLPAASADAPGALYTETNAAHNQIVAFDRRADGTIAESQRIDTGGAGSPAGNPPFPQNHLDANNEIELTANGRLLFAVN